MFSAGSVDKQKNTSGHSIDTWLIMSVRRPKAFRIRKEVAKFRLEPSFYHTMEAILFGHNEEGMKAYLEIPHKLEK